MLFTSIRNGDLDLYIMDLKTKGETGNERTWFTMAAPGLAPTAKDRMACEQAER